MLPFPAWRSLLTGLLSFCIAGVGANAAPPSAVAEDRELADVLGSPSSSGASGLLHTSTASPLRARTLRLGLRGQFFSASDFLVRGDENRQLRRDLVWSYSPEARLELFGAWLNSTNQNRRARVAGDTDPEVIRTVGDLSVGMKASIPINAAWNVGFEVGLKLQSGASDLLWSPTATSFWLGPVATFDAGARGGIPLRAHVSLDYLADHSSNLNRSPEASLAARRVTDFAYGIGGNRLRAALALDLAWSVLVRSQAVSGLAFVEYGWEYATHDADAYFKEYLPPTCGTLTAVPACGDRRNAQRWTLGVRATVYRKLSAELGLDLVAGSPSPPRGPPLPPHNLVLGLAYPLDLSGWFQHTPAGGGAAFGEGPSSPERPGPRPEPSPQPALSRGPAVAPPAGRRGGDPGAPPSRVRENGAPPPAATMPGPPSEGPQPQPQPTATAGAPSRGRPPGAGPHAGTMVVRGRVADPTGRGLQAALMVRGGQQSFEAVSDGQGLFEVSLLPGKHTLRVQSPGFELQELQIEAVAGTEATLDVRLQPPALDPNVQLEARAIKVGRAIRFVNGGTELTADAQLLLKSVAEVLGAHPEISLLRIVAFWDDSLARTSAEELTLRQAEAVRAFLVGRGIAENRLVAEGGGAVALPVGSANASANPLARQRLRRVEFQIVR